MSLNLFHYVQFESINYHINNTNSVSIVMHDSRLLKVMNLNGRQPPAMSCHDFCYEKTGPTELKGE